MRGAYFAAWLVCPLLHGLPWLFDHWLSAPISWLGIVCGLFLATAPGPWNRLWCLWIWASLSIGIAFHWSPGAMAFTLSSEYWMGFLVALPLILWDGLRLALGYWIGARLCARREWMWLSAGCATILLEEFMPGVFPWRLGMMQLPWPWWLQAVDLFGAGWSTLLSFTVAGLIYSCLVRLFDHRLPKLAEVHRATDGESKPNAAARGVQQSVSGQRSASVRWAVALAIGLLLANATYCQWSWSFWQSEIRQAQRVRMGLVQVDPSYKTSLQELQDLTRQIAADVDLVCWPESSAGTYDLRLEELSNPERNFQMSREPERGLRPWPEPMCELLLAGKNYQASMLTPVAVDLTTQSAGEPASAETAANDLQPERLYVSAMLLDQRERIVARYNKRYLMPFGEYVPGEQTVPGLAALFDMAEHVTPGNGAAVLASQSGARLGVMLCYEDMVPQAVRSAVLQDANVIVSLINGSAFSSPVTLHQHRLLSHMRALEARRSFVRCAATGQTCVISACGEVSDRLPLQTSGALTSQVALLQGKTLYAQFPYLWLGVVVPCLVTISMRARSSRDS